MKILSQSVALIFVQRVNLRCLFNELDDVFTREGATVTVDTCNVFGITDSGSLSSMSHFNIF